MASTAAEVWQLLGELAIASKYGENLFGILPEIISSKYCREVLKSTLTLVSSVSSSFQNISQKTS